MQQTCQSATDKKALPNQISLGSSKTKRSHRLRVYLTICGFLALVCELLVPILGTSGQWFVFFIITVPWLYFLGEHSEEFYLDFDRGIYIYEKSLLPGVRLPGDRFTSGSLSEIEHIHLGAIYQDKSINYAGWLVFHPHLKRPPLIFHNSSGHLTAKQMMLLLQIAARLNVPLQDESGWGVKWYKPMLREKRYIILPGEAHPLMPTKK